MWACIQYKFSCWCWIHTCHVFWNSILNVIEIHRRRLEGRRGVLPVPVEVIGRRDWERWPIPIPIPVEVTAFQVSRDGRFLVCEEGGGKHRLSEHDLGSLIELGYWHTGREFECWKQKTNTEYQYRCSLTKLDYWIQNMIWKCEFKFRDHCWAWLLNNMKTDSEWYHEYNGF